MKIALICAMQEEANIIIEKYSLKKNTDFYFDVYENSRLILLISRIGKIYAGLGAYYLINNYEFDLMINIGLAGGINPKFKTCNVFFGNKVIQHDVYIPWKGAHLDYLKGEISIENDLNIIKDKNIDFKTGTILTGDQFIDDSNKAKKLSKKGDIVDMEAFAIASVCRLFDIPILIIKAISDNACDKAKGSFEKNIHQAMKNSIKVLSKVIKKTC